MSDNPFPVSSLASSGPQNVVVVQVNRRGKLLEFHITMHRFKCSLVGRLSLKPLRQIGDWEAPATPYRNEANAETDGSSNDCHHRRRKVQHMAYDHHGSTGERSNSVKLGTQNGGNLRDQHVAQHAA